MVQRFGSIIGLKPEYEERYIILHKHTFPGVLKRIHDSNIRDYSIFLREGRLFSYFEYQGQDYDEDMQNIGRDTITQEWWKLTDPMQEPIQDRKEGEWWASMDEIGHFLNAESSVTHTRRLAYRTQEESEELENVDIPENILSAGHVHKLSVFYKERRLYLYCECTDTSGFSPDETKQDVIDTTLSRITCDNQMFHWESMREVFHTD
jgi:L-rhamnose mutarotase